MSSSVRPPPPVLTDEQRRAALAKAARARQLRAELKVQLKQGLITLPELFARADTDAVVGRLKVLSMLEAMPGTGKILARRIMRELNISEQRRLKGLGSQQRTGLLTHFKSIPQHD